MKTVTRPHKPCVNSQCPNGAYLTGGHVPGPGWCDLALPLSSALDSVELKGTPTVCCMLGEHMAFHPVCCAVWCRAGPAAREGTMLDCHDCCIYIEVAIYQLTLE